MKDINPFILQTAHDYDMPYEEVERIYNSCEDDKLLFYEKLEDYIKARANKN